MRRGVGAAAPLAGLLLVSLAGCSLISGGFQGPATGRSVCDGAVLDATGIVPDAGVDEMERMQNTYEGGAGFLAVVWDNRRPVIIVERDRLAAWQAGLAAAGVAVAPSCIDPAVLGLVQRALPLLNDHGVRSGGYDAIDDAVSVGGVELDALLGTFERLQPGSSDLARSAISAGTLRVGPADVASQRQ